MKFKSLFSLVVVVLLASCADQTKNVQPIVDAYYETYAQRNDFEKLLSYYDESILLEDYINGDKIQGKTALREFLDWDNPNFNMVELVALTIADQMIEGNKVNFKLEIKKENIYKFCIK